MFRRSRWRQFGDCAHNLRDQTRRCRLSGREFCAYEGADQAQLLVGASASIAGAEVRRDGGGVRVGQFPVEMGVQHTFHFLTVHGGRRKRKGIAAGC